MALKNLKGNKWGKA